MRIYISGAGGMLGSAMREHFLPDNIVLATDIEGPDGWWDYNDVRDYATQHYAINEFRPNVIINLAALTDLEYCEGHENEAITTNCGGAVNLAVIAQKFDVPYVYISTAGIFDGSNNAAYTENDSPTPLSLYGKAKYYGELIAQFIPKHYVVRSGWMMGGGPDRDKKFINLLYKQLVAGATEINAVTDKAGTPTYTYDLARTIDVLMRSGQYGLYNCTCKGSTNRFEIAQEFVRLMGLENKVRVNLVPSSFFKEKYFAPRPASETLDCSKLEATGLSRMRDWRECLAEYIEEFPKL